MLIPSPIIRSFANSRHGLKAAWKDDASYRRSVWQVVAGIILATILTVWLDMRINAWLTLVASLLPIVIVELLNTAIESVTDKASPERDPLARKAKDVGSAAVLMTRLITLLCWTVVLLTELRTEIN